MDLGHVYYYGCHLKNAAVNFHPGRERYKFALDSTTYVSYLQFDSCTFGIKTMRSLHIPRGLRLQDWHACRIGTCESRTSWDKNVQMIANRVKCYVHLLVAELKPKTLPTTPLFITLKLSRLRVGNKKNVANSTCWGIWIILNPCWCTFLHFVKLLLPHYAGITLAQRLHGAHKVLGSRLVTLGSRECSWFRPGGKINISINSLGIKGTRIEILWQEPIHTTCIEDYPWTLIHHQPIIKFHPQITKLAWPKLT